MELGLRIPVISGILDSNSSIPDSKVLDSRFLKEKFPRFRITHAKISRIPKYGENFAVCSDSYLGTP